MRIYPWVSKALVALGLCSCVAPFFSSPMALGLGMAIALLFQNPWPQLSKKAVPKVLSFALVALGAGMNLFEVAKVGLNGFSYTLLGIAFTLVLGSVLMRLLKAEYETSLLITVGTAICGGSAIAAAAPAINAKSDSISMALAVVFLLNSAALIIFPALGHSFHFDQNQFGLWAALAIHDTSSVVGATMQYGPQALAVGTTVKLARALWIIPVTFFIGWLHQRSQKTPDSANQPVKKPWFILGFLLCAAFFTFAIPHIPELKNVQFSLEYVGRRAMVVTLFLIGLNINFKSLRAIGPRPVALGLGLWVLMTVLSAVGVWKGWIS